MSQTPSIGRIVHFVLSEGDADAINRRRGDASAHLAEHQERSDGSQIHVGNQVAAGDVYPLIITRVWSETMVNGQVLLDGNDLYWATSAIYGDDGHTWRWPERV